MVIRVGIVIQRALGRPFLGPGLPGLLSERALAAYDAVVYTVGWDEYGEAMRGWVVEEGRDDQMTTTPEGIALDGSRGRASALKGDPTDAYEFMVQVSPDDEATLSPGAKMGIYAVYAGEDDYLTVLVEPATSLLHVEGNRDGKEIERSQVALPANAVGSYHLRTVKLSDRIIIMVDGDQLLNLPGSWPPSQVGLIATNLSVLFPATTLFTI